MANKGTPGRLCATNSRSKLSIHKMFPSESDCITYLERVRWHGKTVCPYCKSLRVSPATNKHRHHCSACNTKFNVTVDTIFHHTHLPLQKWFQAISLILNAEEGVSERKLACYLGVNKKTAWLMGLRIRNAMFEQGELLRGIAEMVECSTETTVLRQRQ